MCPLRTSWCTRALRLLLSVTMLGSAPRPVKYLQLSELGRLEPLGAQGRPCPQGWLGEGPQAPLLSALDPPRPRWWGRLVKAMLVGAAPSFWGWSGGGEGFWSLLFLEANLQPDGSSAFLFRPTLCPGFEPGVFFSSVLLASLISRIFWALIFLVWFWSVLWKKQMGHCYPVKKDTKHSRLAIRECFLHWLTAVSVWHWPTARSAWHWLPAGSVWHWLTAGSVWHWLTALSVWHWLPAGSAWHWLTAGSVWNQLMAGSNSIMLIYPLVGIFFLSLRLRIKSGQISHVVLKNANINYNQKFSRQLCREHILFANKWCRGFWTSCLIVIQM